MTDRITGILTIFVVSSLVSIARADAGYHSIQELWTGIDPRRDPLEVEAVREWSEGELRFKRLYFTGETFESQKVRVYAIQGAPVTGTKLPGILHIHGGGQTASLDWVRFWARRGYVCVSFDYCGDWRQSAPDRKDFTTWGELPYHMAKTNWVAMQPDVRHNPCFHWTLIARRALTFLESHPQVNPAHLGIFGISVGGSLTWLIAGTDERVKAAVPIYGCGWNSYTRPDQTDADPVDEDTQLARKLIHSEAYAPLVHCPLLFLDATNDFHGNMDRSFATLTRVPTPDKRQAYTPRYNHHLEPGEGKDLPLWMDHYLKSVGEPWPTTPHIEFKPGQPSPMIVVCPDRPRSVADVHIYYALNNMWPQSRFWRSAVPRKQASGCFTAAAPFFTAGDVILAFANVTYDSGIRLSSTLIRSATKDLPGAEPSLQWEALIDEMHDSQNWHYGPAYTDPWLDTSYFTPWKGPYGQNGFTLNPAMWTGRDINFDFGTHKIGDPQWRGRGRDLLLLDYDASRSVNDLEIKVKQRDWQLDGHEYTMRADLATAQADAEAPVWHTLEIASDKLRDDKGNALADWAEVNLFTLTGIAKNDRPPLFRNLRWKQSPAR